MIIIELTYKKPIDVVNEFVDEHIAFLKKYYEKGIFLASGQKNPHDGGIIVALGDKDTIIKIIQEDAFVKNDVVNYRVTEFVPNRYHKVLEKIICDDNSHLTD
ncbi:MAG: YciI family protein [Rickettsia endosymbiont of Ixodes persulcatus]|nr:YciI family protein [Rickettsia endosymbiont of Ixodes persulcatus]